MNEEEGSYTLLLIPLPKVNQLRESNENNNDNNNNSNQSVKESFDILIGGGVDIEKFIQIIVSCGVELSEREEKNSLIDMLTERANVLIIRRTITEDKTTTTVIVIVVITADIQIITTVIGLHQMVTEEILRDLR